MTAVQATPGLRKNGKPWQSLTPRHAFRPNSAATTSSTSASTSAAYKTRMRLTREHNATKAVERELKADKADERDRRVQRIRERRKAKEDKERMEKLGQKMHAKVLERRKRKEKRKKGV